MELLESVGASISIANNGREVVERVLRDLASVDLVLMGLQMPKMDGFRACQQIRASTAWREIPVIFLTARADTADIVRGFELGAVDYVAKPFNAHELLARVRTHLTLDNLYRENQRLLLNVLPASIAEKLKQQVGNIQERFDDVSVIFADIVGFTPLTSRLSPTELIELLNTIFSSFDELADQYGLEKIKTMGDAYMVAGGLIEPNPDHLEAMAHMALAMHERVGRLSSEFDGLSVRIGLHTGSVIAGVIGIRTFIYDIWGDAVNTAARLESDGVPGRIHVSDTVYERLHGRFTFEARGVVELTGCGPTQTYFLQAPNPVSGSA